jgi:hypothetical protein
VNQGTPQLEKLGQQTKTDADDVVRQAFLYGLVLILVLLVGSVLAALAYRALTNKSPKDGRKPDVS